MSNRNPKDRYDPFKEMTFSYDRCFLCGRKLESSETQEHVFPRWLLHRHDLWDKKIGLLNGTGISYRQLTIPCCEKCNNEKLSEIENLVRERSKAGYKSFKKLNRQKLYQWLLKIFYGLLFKELSLADDLEDPESRRILDPEELKQFSMLHRFLQSTHTDFEFKTYHPWSIFIFKTIPNLEFDFDYHDALAAQVFALRTNDIGIIAVLEDNGSQEKVFGDYFEKFKTIGLHPIQFDELTAMVHYQARLLDRTPKYLLGRHPGQVEVTSFPLQGFSRGPIYDEWDWKEYAIILKYYWKRYGITFDEIYGGDKGVYTLLEDDEGNPILLNKDGKPRR